MNTYKKSLTDEHEMLNSSTHTVNQLSAGKRSTKLSFFVAGFGLACWAPLVPFAHERLDISEATLGTILLFLGLGAVLSMPISGSLSSKLGSRPIITVSSIGIAIALPLMASVTEVATLALALFIFGAAIGAIDVAANIHGSDVQEAAKKPLMSGFHSLYSIGGLAGAFGMTALLASGIPISVATGLCSVMIIICCTLAYRGFFQTTSNQEHPFIVLPRGIVTLIGLTAMVIFLAEGAMLDWSALLFNETKGIDLKLAGSGYVAFTLAMAISRIIGDRLVAHIGEKSTLYTGILLTGVGIIIVTATNSFYISLVGMALTGFAAGNVVPVLFTMAGRQSVMPAALAISSASILGYLGVLLGPALLGYVAQLLNLNNAFYIVAAMVLIMLFTVRPITNKIL